MGCNINKRLMAERDLVQVHSFLLGYANSCDLRTDAKSVSIIALGCFHPVVKVQSASIHFFLGGDDENENCDEDENVR